MRTLSEAKRRSRDRSGRRTSVRCVDAPSTTPTPSGCSPLTGVGDDRLTGVTGASSEAVSSAVGLTEDERARASGAAGAVRGGDGAAEDRWRDRWRRRRGGDRPASASAASAAAASAAAAGAGSNDGVDATRAPGGKGRSRGGGRGAEEAGRWRRTRRGASSGERATGRSRVRSRTGQKRSETVRPGGGGRRLGLAEASRRVVRAVRSRRRTRPWIPSSAACARSAASTEEGEAGPSEEVGALAVRSVDG